MEMDTKKITQEPYDKADLDEAVETLRRGGIILYPTDTVWGIGCDATNEEAVRRIYELKRREDSKSMLVLVGETYEVERLVSEVPEVAYDLMELAVRPITIIYPHATGVAPNLLGEGGSTTLAHFLEAELYDDLLIEVCPRTLGKGIPAPHLPQPR